jgi:hypothetical protein
MAEKIPRVVPSQLAYSGAEDGGQYGIKGSTADDARDMARMGKAQEVRVSDVELFSKRH